MKKCKKKINVSKCRKMKCLLGYDLKLNTINNNKCYKMYKKIQKNTSLPLGNNPMVGATVNVAVAVEVNAGK